MKLEETKKDNVRERKKEKVWTGKKGRRRRYEMNDRCKKWNLWQNKQKIFVTLAFNLLLLEGKQTNSQIKWKSTTE